MEIHHLDPFISYETLIFLEMLLVFGGLIWFAQSQIRAVRRSREEESRPSSLARRPTPPARGGDAPGDGQERS